MNFTKCEATNISRLFEENRFAISEKLRDNIDWNKVFSTIVSYQYTHNGNMMRFAKSNLVCLALERWSNGYLDYVDQIGYDFLTADGYKMEMKSALSMFHHKSETTADIIMKNMNGSIADLSKVQKTFDFLLLLEPGYAAVTDWETAFPYFKENSDTIKVKLDFKHIEFIKRIQKIKNLNYDLADRFDEAMQLALDDIDLAYQFFEESEETQ